jgi:hypothetical protein
MLITIVVVRPGEARALLERLIGLGSSLEREDADRALGRSPPYAD